MISRGYSAERNTRFHRKRMTRMSIKACTMKPATSCRHAKLIRLLIHLCHGEIPITSRELTVHPIRIIFPFSAYVPAARPLPLSLSSSSSRKERDNLTLHA